MVKGQLGLIKKITVKDAWVNSGATGLPRATQWQLTSIKFQLNTGTQEGIFSRSAFKKIAEIKLFRNFLPSKLLAWKIEFIQHKIRFGKLKGLPGYLVPGTLQ